MRLGHVTEPASDYQSTYTPGWGYLIPTNQAPLWLYDSWIGAPYTMPAATPAPVPAQGGGVVVRNTGGGAPNTTLYSGGNRYAYYSGGHVAPAAAGSGLLASLTANPLLLAGLGIAGIVFLTQGRRK